MKQSVTEMYYLKKCLRKKRKLLKHVNMLPSNRREKE